MVSFFDMIVLEPIYTVMEIPQIAAKNSKISDKLEIHFQIYGQMQY